MAISKVRSRSQAPAASILSCSSACSAEQLVEVGVGLAHGRAHLVEPVDQRLGLGHAVGHVAEDVLVPGRAGAPGPGGPR